MLALALSLCVLAADEPAVPYATWVDQLTDLSWLLRPPPPGERCIQFSSFDRASLSGPGDPEKWYANDDYAQFLRVEEESGAKRYVMVDTPGPGLVVRVWSANPSGSLRFEIDGAIALEIDFQDLTSGKKAPFLAPLCGEHSRGWNCYVPLPFQKHLKVSASTGKFYYHVDVRLLPAGTHVEPYSSALLQAPANAAALERARAILAKPDALSPAPVQPSMLPLDASAPAGGSAPLFKLEGAGLVRRLALEPASSDLREALRTCRLTITFDGEKTPRVDAPLGDFFGTAPDWQPCGGYPLGVREDGTGYCHFPMPYQHGATAALVNEGSAAISARGELVIDGQAPAADAMGFQAKWHIEKNIKTRPRRDFVILDAKGRGRYVGCALSVRNPVRAWWGEGDEKFYVDGESFPSTFGTGTEDYFGYAWCWPVPFAHAFHNQSRCDGPGNAGYTSVNRFQILDQVPFEQSFHFDLEVWHWEDVLVDYASMAYWYATPGGRDAFAATTAAERRAPPETGPPIKHVAGALEGEKLKVLLCTGGQTQSQDMSGFGADWSGDKQLWWTGGKPGARLELELNVARAGKQHVLAQLTRARDYGIVQLSLDGTPLGPPLDLYRDSVTASGELDLGERDLTSGPHRLVLEITGANPKAEKAYMAGLDYVRVAPNP
jgi:hypothetical protein